MKLGQMLVKMRKENELTQEDFAQKFNVTRQTVSNWENEKSYPDLLTLVKISDEFNCSLDAMLKENYAMTEDFNKKMKYGEESALFGGLSAIFLFISAIAMIILKYGNPYTWVLFLIQKQLVLPLTQPKKKERKPCCCLQDLFVLWRYWYLE